MSTLTHLLVDWFTIATTPSRTVGTPQGLIGPNGSTVWSSVDERQAWSTTRSAPAVADAAIAAPSRRVLRPATQQMAT